MAKATADTIESGPPEKIKWLSPVLVLSADTGADIADGYHRVSLVYRIDPYAEVPLKLA
jgi:hypothetical protein